MSRSKDDEDVGPPRAGHNSFDSEELRDLVIRIEDREEAKDAVLSDIKAIYKEAKDTGFDVKTVRRLVSLRKLDNDKRKADQERLEVYAEALGMDLV